MISSTQNLIESKVSIFPNPVQDQLTISINFNFKKFRIISSLGQEMWNSSSNNQDQLLLNVQHWPPGQYYLFYEGIDNCRGQRRFTKS